MWQRSGGAARGLAALGKQRRLGAATAQHKYPQTDLKESGLAFYKQIFTNAQRSFHSRIVQN